VQRVDSGVLVGLNRILRATGGELDVFFDDGNLQQVLDVASTIRRSGAPFGNDRGGIFVVKMANTHGGAGILTASLDLYSQLDTALGTRAPLDVWLLEASIISTVVTDYASFPILNMDFAPQPNFLSSMDANVQSMVAGWEVGKSTFASSATVFQPLQLSRYRMKVQRLPRGATLKFSTNAPGAESNTCFIRVGFFPVGLGQDAVGTS
jgi:hypothetical protein